MAFVKKELTDADREKAGVFINADFWHVDEARNAYFMYTGGEGMGEVWNFELHWQGAINKVQVTEQLNPLEKENGRTRYDIVYNFIYLQIAESLRNQAHQVYTLIEQAFKEHGFHGNKEVTALVTIIPPSPDKIGFKSDDQMRTVYEIQQGVKR